MLGDFMAPASVITIGNFDGVHLGHQALLRCARQVAGAHAARVIALTFDPHPAAVLRPGSDPPRLMSVDDRTRALLAGGADAVEVLRPTPQMLEQSPQPFVEQLCRQFQPVAIVEGSDFRFGRDRIGDMAVLASMGRRLGFEVVTAPTFELALSDMLLVPVRSSVIRWLLGYGRVVDAARCLGRLHALRGQVIVGERRGRLMAVPTINLDLAHNAFVIPADGVYAGVAELPDGAIHAAAISIGVKPTFNQATRTVEAHLLDFSGDLYDQRVTLRFARWLRDQQRFPNVEALKAQLQRDLAQTRSFHQRQLLAHPEFFIGRRAEISA